MAASRGTRLIIGYKLTKGSLEALFGLVLAALVLARREAALSDIAEQLHAHFTGEWSVRLAEATTAAAAASRKLWAFVVAFALDGTFTVLEGLALVRGAWWGPWVVVVATSAFVPFEIAALVHHLRVGRLFLLGVNVVIVGYLVRRALGGASR
jgi:uncharacterized membrane protein (DUF2068 family)